MLYPPPLIGKNIFIECHKIVIEPNKDYDLRPSLLRNGVTQDLLLGRWRLSLELFGRVFIDDVGAEPGSVINQLGGFPFKEAKFRREMEKLRNSQQRDFNLTKVSQRRIDPKRLSNSRESIRF